MSRSNIPGCENKSEKILNLSDVRKLTNMPEFVNRGRNIMNNEFLVDNHILQSHILYDLNDDCSDIKKTCLNVDSKKLMNKSYEDDKQKLISNVNDQHEEMSYEHRGCLPDVVDGNDESIPLVNIFKYNKAKNVMTSSQNNADPYRESFPPNKMPLRMFVGDVQDIPNIPSIPATYNNFNGYHINRVKNVSSYGSSFMNNVHPQSLFSLQNPQSLENHDFRNQTKPIKSQNVYFSQQVGDFMEQNSEVDFKKMHLKKDNNIKLVDGSNIPIVNNSKILIPCPVGRKEAILIQQPECYETELYPNMGEMCLENLVNHSSVESNEVPPNVLRDNFIPVDYIYPNNCYAPQFPIIDNRKNISHINQQIPFQLIPVQGSVLLNSNVNPNFRNMNAYSHYCLTPIPSSYVAYPTDKSKLNMKPVPIANPPDPIIQKHKSTDESYSFYTPDHGNLQQKHQQFSSNNELSRGDNFSMMTSNESVVPNVSLAEPTFYLNIAQQNTPISEPIKMHDPLINCITSSSNSTVPSDNNTDRPVQKIGKFIVTPVSTNEQPISVAKSTENHIPTDNPTIQNYVADDIPKLDRPQQNSRFKKTRIRETVERWCMDGLNTYDCRFKIIPSKIMSLYNSKPEYLSKEIDINQSCRRCEAHDKEKYCYDVDYHKKEFKFWHNGNHLDLLCAELEENSENYCQFHAKILKLLNQNQNLSLSKYSNNLFDFSENTNLASPQLFQTVLISSPEHDNYIINIDTQASHVLLSAPPVSPSVMNTASISSLPTNIQSPRSATTMVMLKCATPVLLSNATRNATLLNESISIEKINHKASSNMGIDSDNNSICGPQIVANENSPLIDLWQSSPIKSDQLAFKLSSPTYVAGTVIADNSHIQGDLYNHQHSVYSIGHMSPLYYPLYQQPRPSISSTMITNKCQDQNSFISNKDLSASSDNLPAEMIEEINRSTNSFKSVITNLFQVEHSKLLGEISVLRKSNEQLANELLKMKTRSDNLEKLLQAKHDLSDNPHSKEHGDLLENATNINNTEVLCSECHQTEFDYNNLI